MKNIKLTLTLTFFISIINMKKGNNIKGEVTMNKQIDIQVENFKKTFSKINTRKNYSSDVILFIKYLDEEYSINTLTDFKNIKTMHIKTYLAYLKEKENRSNATINRKKTSISKFFNFLIENSIVDINNPTLKIKNLEVNNRHNIYLRKEKLISFIKYIETRKPKAGERMSSFTHKRDLALFLLTIKTGLRAEEVCNLKLEDISFLNKRIYVRDRKNGIDNIVQINDKEMIVLQDYLQLRDSLKNKKEFVFLSIRGKQLDDKSLNCILNKYLTELNMNEEHITFHKLRHSFAHFYLKNGGNMKGLQMALGHKNSTTTNIYAHLDTEDVFEKINKIDLLV